MVKRFGKILLISLWLFRSVPDVQAQDFIGINCGTDFLYFTSPQGDLFYPDQPYTGGFGYIGDITSMQGIDRPITNDEGMDSLYFFWREGDFSYLFDVPDGDYAVNIYLSEKQFHWKDFRTFSIVIEGDTVVQDLDVFALANLRQACPMRFLTQCDDGQIQIDFLPGIWYAMASAVSVRAISPDADPPPVPQNFNALDGYEMNILYWDYVVADDLAGYRVYRRLPGGAWTLVSSDPYPLYSYFDFDAEPGSDYEYAVTAVDLWGNESDLSDIASASPMTFESTTLPRYYFYITDDALHQLNVNIWSYEYVPADLWMEGEWFPDSWLRYRGSQIRVYPKKSYRFKLDNGQTHNDWERFNEMAQYSDVSMIKEKLAYDMYDSMAVISPQTRHLHLERHTDDLDEFLGVYLEVERVDNDFLEHRGLSRAGNLYKCKANLAILPTYEDYQFHYEKVNNDSSDWYDIIDFIEWFNQASPAEFHEALADRFSLDDYLDIYVVQISTQDTDFINNNFYFYNNPVDGRWYFIPWDHNETFEDPFAPINYGTHEEPGVFDDWNRLLDKVMADSLFRYAYCKKLQRWLQSEFTLQSLMPQVDAIHQNIYTDGLADYYKYGWGRPEIFLAGPDSMQAFLQDRIPFLLSEINGYITDPELAPYMRFNEIQADNRTTLTDEAGDYDPWIEIYNLAPVELDLEGFTLSQGADAWVLPAEAVVDAYGFLIVWMDGETSEGPLHCDFRLSAQGGTLQLEGRQGGTADTVSYPSLQSDQVWARLEDGSGEWSTQLSPTPGSTNTPLIPPTGLVINELLAINTATNPDEAGDYDDWLEIYNPTADTIWLGGVYLTDDYTRPTRWAFPDTTIYPGQFLLVWCDNEPWEGIMHATFKLSGGGEEAILLDRDGVTQIDAVTFGEQVEDVSWGRYPDGSGDWFPCAPTPGDANVGVISSPTDAGVPGDFFLDPVYPNPFNSSTVIRFGLPRPVSVELKVYDVLGREVAVLVDEKLQAGYHAAFFRADDLPSGIYLYRLKAGSFSTAGKMVLIK